jgi:inner membrane protein
MASLGHLAVGLAAARLSPGDRQSRSAFVSALVFWSALSFLPDADVLGFSLGVRYEDAWGHRGATHSIAFSVALGALIGAGAAWLRQPAPWTGVTATLVLLSHACLDTLTDGGLGCALFWPFDQTRYFAPWRPLPVFPLGVGIFTPYGVYAAVTELLLFAPLMWIALCSRRPPVAAVTVWLAGLWIMLSGDPVRERVFRAVMRDDTVFAHGFSEDVLASLSTGDRMDDVERRLGPPMGQFYDYDRADGCGVVVIENEIVTRAWPEDHCRADGLQVGGSGAAISALGAPRRHCWLYSRSPDSGYYRARVVCFADGRVTQVIKRYVRE